MASTIIGVDFGGGVLRAVELADLRKPKPTIVRYNEMPLPEGAVVRGEVIEPNTVANALKKLWSAGGFKSRTIAMGIGNHRVIARDLTLPRMSRARLRESLPFHVQDVIPMPVDEALLDFYPVEEADGESGPQIQGLLVAAAKDAVLNNIKAARLAGLDTVDVDLLPFAVSRVAIHGASASGTVVLVDVGAGTTSVIIATNGVPQFLRLIPTGGMDLTQGLATRLETNLVEADRVKRSIGLSAVPVAAENQRALEVIYELTGELLTSIRNTITYFANTRPNRDPSRILLTGGGASLPGFDRGLTEMTRLPVHYVDPFERFTVSKSIDAGALREFGSGATAALGLAIGAAA